jgi:hypothetical protein
MSPSRRYLAAAIGLSCLGAFALLACSDDDTNPGEPSTTDGGGDASPHDSSVTPIQDSTTGIDSTTPNLDSGSDAKPTETTDADADATVAPTSTEALNSTGFIRIMQNIAFAEFYVDDLTVRWSNAPECLIVARFPNKAQAAAGTVTIGGAVVGKDGGPAAPVTLESDFGYVAEDQFFPATNEFTIDVDEAPTSTGFPPLPVQTLPTSVATPVPILLPSADAGADGLKISTTKPLEIKWTAPTGPGDLTNQRMMVELQVNPSEQDTGRFVRLFCAYPLTAGAASIPAEVLADMKARAGGGTPGGNLSLLAGGQRTVTVKDTATYVVEVARESDSTDYTPATGVTLE